jgi:ABC-type uncharacterized transport system substrate-binding protein
MQGEKSMKKTTSTLFILATLLFASVYPAHAQKATTPRIGVLYLGAAPNANVDAFIQGLRELGYIEGKSIHIEYRFAEGKAERLPELARELVLLKVDAIFTAGTPAISLLEKRLKRFLSFSSARAIRLEWALSLVLRTRAVISRASPSSLRTYGPNG